VGPDTGPVRGDRAHLRRRWRSATARDALAQRGFTRVHNLLAALTGALRATGPSCEPQRGWRREHTQGPAHRSATEARCGSSDSACGRGFSLIEVLVVIAIIIVLAAIIFPVYSSARRRAQQTVCASNLAQIHKALFMYVMDQDSGGPPNLSGLGGPDWPDAVLGYVGTPDILRCPAADEALTDPLSGRPIGYGFHTTLALAFGGERHRL